MLASIQENTTCFNITEYLMNLMQTEFHRKKEEVIRDLLTCNYSELKYKCKNDENTKLIKDIFDVIKQLPPILTILKTKPEIPVFEEIEVFNTDSNEIKKFIRKINVKMLWYSCNHKSIDEQCDGIIKNITDLLSCEQFVSYQEFIERGANNILMILKHNSNEEESHLVFGTSANSYMNACYFYNDVLVKEVVDSIIRLNGKISGSNSKTNQKCSKCEAIIRLYNYSIKEVNRMLEEAE